MNMTHHGWMELRLVISLCVDTGIVRLPFHCQSIPCGLPLFCFSGQAQVCFATDKTSNEPRFIVSQQDP